MVERPRRRKDADRNRQAVLEAARQLFAESGDVAMYEVARRAGVGQATLYRNFPDRESLIAALAAEQLDALERVGTERAGEPNSLYVLLRAIVETQARFPGLVECAAHDASSVSADLEPVQQRLVELLRGSLRDAQVAGLLRPDFTLEDVFLVMAMVDGALAREGDPGRRAAVAARVLALALDGAQASPTGSTLIKRT
jgi:AcrR family transcriptional regulator